MTPKVADAMIDMDADPPKVGGGGGRGGGSPAPKEAALRKKDRAADLLPRPTPCTVDDDAADATHAAGAAGCRGDSNMCDADAGALGLEAIGAPIGGGAYAPPPPSPTPSPTPASPTTPTAGC